MQVAAGCRGLPLIVRRFALRGNPLSGNCECRRTVARVDNLYRGPIKPIRKSGSSLSEALWISQWQWAWHCSGCSRAVRFIFSIKWHA